AEGGRHPRALGMRGRDFWTDIWDIIGPEIDGVMSRGEATWHENRLVPIERNGRLEDVYWTYGYSPVRDDDGSIAGTLVVCQETTSQMMTQALQAERAQLRERLETAIAAARIDGATLAALSMREQDVLMRIAKGYSNKEIAGDLKLSVKTIETYKSRMVEKLGFKSRVDIVRYAAQAGWLSDA
ncbi:MAG: LuxR C-terminal-related transcriptional regulator, partial [Gemmatimonadota bacterium]|nr:LuxR C-terminal-related transcriptional regulator [Gemmatimonadota bacterium]